MAKEKSKPVPKFWNMVTISGTEAEILLYGEIRTIHPVDWWTGQKLEGMYITPEGFLEDLANIKDKSKITIRINSVGGDFYTGLAIYTQLKSLPGEKIVVVDGIAASAASLIAMAGDTIKMPAGALMMIHDVLSGMCGYYNKTELEQISNVLDTLATAAAEIYASKTGLSIDEIRAIMTAETWLTGRQAVEQKFADEILFEEPDISINETGTTMISNNLKMCLSGYKNVPQMIAVKNSIPADGGPHQNIKNLNKGENRMKTIEELKNEHPELVNQIIDAAKAEGEAEGIAKERNRLASIDDIQAAIGSPELLKKAKYGDEICSAEELAFKAIKMQAQKGAEHLANFSTDVQASGATNVVATPNAGMPATTMDKQAADRTAAIAKILGKGE